MPFISVKMLRGRSDQQKRDLVKAMTDAMVEICGAPEEGTMVVLEEFEPDQWAVGGTMVSQRQST
jgi:4-oxalocrotonate tautomerase